MSFSAYPAYKDSGVEWLGKTPQHWSVYSLKRTVDGCVNGLWGDEPDGENDIAVIRVADFQRSSSTIGLEKLTYRSITAKERQSRLIKSGDLLIEKSGGGEKTLVGCVVLFAHDFDAITSNFVARMRPLPDFDSQFLCYAFGNLYDGRVNYPSVKQVTGIQNLDAESYLQERFCFPTRAEQTQIARFLDHETARIDALIKEQHRLIALLKEKRQAVISHAVTKGLDPTMPMKESGVEWLGEVPAHWQQIRIKHVLTAMIDAEHKTAEYHDDGEYLVCRTTNVRNGRLNLEGGKYTDKATYIEWTRRGKPEPLDILFTREAPAGEACLVPSSPEICLGQRMVLFKLNKRRIDPDFLVHSIYAGLASDFVKQLSQGSTVSHFNMADIVNIPLYEAPLSEQRDISNFLAARCGAYDSLIQEAELSVELISERRSALISAAVTGKIDVRGWKPTARELSRELEEEVV